ncbi:MAG: CHAP domain-containing protein [Candidatus Cloacimonetes bacterium]|nr:CHAP domain-containing protein [Candidatus Cloacimonadota bacterium]
MLKRINIFIAIFSILLLCGCEKKERMEKAAMNPKFHNLPPEVQEQLKEEVTSGEMDISEAEEIIENSGGDTVDASEASIDTEELSSEAGDATEGWPQSKSDEAQRIAASDNAGSGYCAKGVANILLQMDYPVTRGNAHDWDTTLPQNGWKKITCSPASCPAGSVLQFDSNYQLQNGGQSVSGGGRWGHVEIVTKKADGSTTYCSDRCRNNWGGTVPGNFGGAWVYEETN